MSSDPSEADGSAAAVAIVGAGAAGLMTAIEARRARPGLRVLLLEGRPRPGAKILVSGGGRCNVTNRELHPADFHGDRRAIARVLDRFGVEATVAWFERIGVPLVVEPEFGKLFPRSNSARTVLAALLDTAAALGVELHAGFRVESVRARSGGGFELVASSGTTLHAQRLVLATGGRSLPRSGSDGSGYRLARELGHTVTATAPALVPLVLAPNPFANLAGISLPAAIEVWSAGRRTARVAGPLLLTHFGLSGPAALDVSRHWTTAGAPQPELRLALLAGSSPEAVEADWLALARRPGRPVAAALLAALPARLARWALERAHISPDAPLAGLDRPRRRELLGLVTAFPLPVAGTRGWNEAEVTAGGVPLTEVSTATLESRRVPGLYLVGEILDVDGRIGGFNFQWAWSTGFVAGQALARG